MLILFNIIKIVLKPEWFYRLAKQPARVGRQIILVKCFWKLMIGKI